MVDGGELILADGGYADGRQYFLTPTGDPNTDQAMKAVARARHEVINGGFKRWGILKQIYRHDRNKHGTVMLALANITQLQLEADELAWDVDYGDDMLQ